MPELSEPGFHPADSSPAAQPLTARRSFAAASPLARVGFALFGVGLLAVIVTLVLFATGSHDLPLWLNLVCLLAPVGFGLGLLGVYREARASRRLLGARQDTIDPV